MIMDCYDLVLKRAEAAVDENEALKAEVARLKQQNESLEIRLDAAQDKVTSLQRLCKDETDKRQTLEKTLNEIGLWWGPKRRKKAQRTREILESRGAPKRKDTTLAALQVVCHWDRDACLEDLNTMQTWSDRMIGALASGRELMMDDVAKAMNEDGYKTLPSSGWDLNLHEVLIKLTEQLRRIYFATPSNIRRSEWNEFPLRLFTLDPDSDSDMDDEIDADL
jgi:hypothetical protein